MGEKGRKEEEKDGGGDGDDDGDDDDDDMTKDQGPRTKDKRRNKYAPPPLFLVPFPTMRATIFQTGGRMSSSDAAAAAGGEEQQKKDEQPDVTLSPEQESVFKNLVHILAGTRHLPSKILRSLKKHIRNNDKGLRAIVHRHAPTTTPTQVDKMKEEVFDYLITPFEAEWNALFGEWDTHYAKKVRSQRSLIAGGQ